jgi:hypothetical protein
MAVASQTGKRKKSPAVSGKGASTENTTKVDNSTVSDRYDHFYVLIYGLHVQEWILCDC